MTKTDPPKKCRILGTFPLRKTSKTHFDHNFSKSAAPGLKFCTLLLLTALFPLETLNAPLGFKIHHFFALNTARSAAPLRRRETVEFYSYSFWNVCCCCCCCCCCFAPPTASPDAQKHTTRFSSTFYVDSTSQKIFEKKIQQKKSPLPSAPFSAVSTSFWIFPSRTPSPRPDLAPREGKI